MRETKRRLETFSFFEYTAIARHLEEMAEKGWLIEKISNFGWLYRRIEPKKLEFFVSYYPKASEFDPEPSREQKEFHDFCQHTGWVLAASFAQMQIFYNEQENPTPIETDPVLEIETIHAAAKKSYLLSYGFLLLLSVLNMAMFAARLSRDFAETLSSAANLFTGVMWLLLFFICLMELGGYFRWHTRAEKAAERGEFVETPSHSRRQKMLLGIIGICWAYWVVTMILLERSSMMRTVGIVSLLYMAVLLVLVNGMKALMKRKRVSRSVNRTMTILLSFALVLFMTGILTTGVMWASRRGIFDRNVEAYEYNGERFTAYQDELPLTLEDLFGVSMEEGEGYEGYSKWRMDNDSLLLGQCVAIQDARYDAEDFVKMPRLEYVVTEVRLPFLYDFCKNSLINARQDEVVDGEVVFAEHYELADPSLWRAKEAYRLYWSMGYIDRYLLCYEKRIIEITFSWEPTAEQMAVVGEKLGGE